MRAGAVSAVVGVLLGPTISWAICARSIRDDCYLGVPQTVNVTDFGAVGDGVHDDTVALQAALDAAGPGGSVFLPCGGKKFVVTAALNISNPFVTVTGCATGGVPLANSGGSLIYTNTPNIDIFHVAHRAGGCTHDSNCEDTLLFKDFAISLDDSASGVTAINLTNSNNSQVVHVFIRGTTNITTSIGVLSSGVLDGGAVRGGIDNRVLTSFLYSMPHGVVIQLQANADVINDSRFWGAASHTISHVDVKGVCTGGTCACSGAGPCVPCDVNADCGSCTGTCSSNISGATVIDTKIVNNDIEDPSAGNCIVDRGKSTVITGNYSEMPTGGGQTAIQLDGLEPYVANNFINLSTADSGIRIDSVFVVRAHIEGNTCKGASNGTCINEGSVAASPNFIGHNAYETVGTQIAFGASSNIVWNDPAATVANAGGLNPLSTGNQPGNGSVVYCPTCTPAACGTGGSGAYAHRINGAWVCVQ